MPSTPSPKRGDIVRVRLDPVEGSEQAGERPALVLSPDVINEHCPVILIASLTSKQMARIYPHEVLIEPPEGGLTRRSKVLLMHLRSIDKRRLVGRYGAIGTETMRQVEEALKVATGLIDF
ncbi:MAG TPA: type II toxin-antitoxin system PemK/MazF family toxin [Gemmataceae bacterium]|nr:type II toxin-antitoxin system PemK/MazF family toxin [Gemmataceae bacterium]